MYGIVGAVGAETRPFMTKQFVLQVPDPATGSPMIEARLDIGDITGLRAILGLERDEDPELWHGYELEEGDLKAIGELSEPPFLPDSIFTRIAPWHPIRDVPYLVHTNFELPLLLEGRKPFAAFSDGYPSEWFDGLLRRFDTHVRDGR